MIAGIISTKHKYNMREILQILMFTLSFQQVTLNTGDPMKVISSS